MRETRLLRMELGYMVGAGMGLGLGMGMLIPRGVIDGTPNGQEKIGEIVGMAQIDRNWKLEFLLETEARINSKLITRSCSQLK